MLATQRTNATQAITLLIAVFVITTHHSHAQDSISDEKPVFHKLAYIGVGGGHASLNPVEENGAPLEFDGEAETYKHIYLGRDFTPRLSGEIHFHDLGENLSDSVEISYEDVTLTGLFYLSHRQRVGHSLYGRFGIGDIKTRSDTRIARDHDVHATGGLGYEYSGKNGLSVRTEYWYHDEDASNFSLSLLYRFNSQANLLAPTVVAGVSDESATGVTTDTAREPAIQPPEVFEQSNVPMSQEPTIVENIPTVELISAPIDSVIEYSWCPAGDDFTSRDLSCALTDEAQDSLTFLEGSVWLTNRAKKRLDSIAESLIVYSDVKLKIHAHTDDRGDTRQNIELSTRRARVVAKYLKNKGVALERMSARAFGGAQPVANNDSDEGRAQNRRVELIITPVNAID